MKLRKVGAVLVSLLLIASCMIGCASIDRDSLSGQLNNEETRLRVVATIFPEYDWTRELTKGVKGVDLTLLLSNGSDLHSFQPTAADIAKISTCDVLIYNGGESEFWVEDILARATNPNMVVINLMDVLGDQVKEEEIIEGMQSDDEKTLGTSHSDNSGEEIENDEHIWLSIKNAKAACEYISSKLCEIDSQYEADYQNNLTDYCSKLDELDEKYEATVSNAELGTLIFGDRFPFRYLIEDYGLDYYAAFSGCSAETEASFETVIFLAGKIDETKAPVICTIDGSDQRIAEIVRDNTENQDQDILVMDSMQSVTVSDSEDGVTYLLKMEDNLETLQSALGSK